MKLKSNIELISIYSLKTYARLRNNFPYLYNMVKVIGQETILLLHHIQYNLSWLSQKPPFTVMIPIDLIFINSKEGNARMKKKDVYKKNVFSMNEKLMQWMNLLTAILKAECI